MNDNDREEFLLLSLCVLAVFIATSVFAFVFGATTAVHSKDCEYKTVISYHPARILACELFKERW